MTTEHNELESGIAAYVLGSADAEEYDRLRAHIEGCARCRALAVRLSRGLAALPLEPEPIEPPANLHGRVLAAAAAARARGSRCRSGGGRGESGSLERASLLGRPPPCSSGSAP